MAQDYGVDMPFLPKIVIRRFDSIEDAITYTLNQLKAIDGYQPDVIVLLQPTSPFRTPEYINKPDSEESGESVLSCQRRWTSCRDGIVAKWEDVVFNGGYLPGKQQRQDYQIIFLARLYIFL